MELSVGAFGATPTVVHVTALPADWQTDANTPMAAAEPIVEAFWEGEVHGAPAPESTPVTAGGARKRRRTCTAATVSSAAVSQSATQPPPPARLLREVEAVPPKHLPAMGSFGSYLSYYRHSFGMAPYDAEREAALEDERCSGFLERTQSLFDDFDRRKLLLTMEPPEAYEYARHVMETSASSTTQVHYMFAEQLRVMREPRPRLMSLGLQV